MKNLGHLQPLDAGILILRLGIAWVFLRAGWANVSTAATRAWTRGETALLFRGFVPADHPLVGAAALTGIAIMFGGGIAVLIGSFPRPGGIALALFSLLGIRIHAIRRDEAQAEANASGAPMAWSAYSAHIAAGLKNWALAAGGLFFAGAGTGRLSVGPDPLAHLIAELLST